MTVHNDQSLQNLPSFSKEHVRRHDQREYAQDHGLEPKSPINPHLAAKIWQWNGRFGQLPNYVLNEFDSGHLHDLQIPEFNTQVFGIQWSV